MEDFIVVGGCEGEIAFDFIKGRSVDIFIVHMKKRLIEGG